MSMSRRRVVGHALPALVLLLALSEHAWLLLAALRSVYWLVVRLAQLAVVLVGSGSFWWVLRSYQLAKEQELLDQAWSKYQFYERYRQRSSSSGSRVSESATSKRLPVNAHLRTAWRLPPDVSDELALVVQCAVRDYVAYWFEPISPVNDDFQRDLKRLLADLLGALTARVLAIDSSQALALAASVLELVRLHLGWFREAYAQLEETDPSVFQGDDALDAALLARRQVLVAAYAQTAAFLHPGCVAAAPGPASGLNNSATSRKTETPEVVYLRHVAAQVLQQLQPELGAAQCESNVVVSMVSSLLREAATFKVLAPLAEYAQPQFANELALALLQSLGADDKDAPPLSPTHSASPSPAAGVGGMTLQRLRLTKSLLYRATKRSSEQAEAAFQAVVDVVSAAAASSAAVANGVTGHSDAAFDGDDWHDASPDVLRGPASAPSASRRTSHERKQPFASLFSFDDRLSLPRTSRLKTPRAFRPAASLGAGTSGLKSAAAAGAAHMDDLKNIKANIGSSLNKVKRRFRTLSGHPNDAEAPHAGAGSSAFASTQAAARMMKKPGMLLQKALRRHDGPMTPSMMATMGMSPMSPTNSLDEVLTPPPLSDDDFGGHESPLSEPPSPTPRPDAALSIDELAGDTDDDDVDDVDVDDEDLADDDDDESVDIVENGIESPPKPDALSPLRAVDLLDKAVANYVRMGAERPEMRTSARARELYDLLAALEAVFALGYHDPVENVDNVDTVDQFDTGNNDDHDNDDSTERSDRDAPQYWRYFAVERSETPFLTEHWQFVSTKCPSCVPSESFVSTRGVQWLLVALEKGALWEYVTALHLNASVTAQFYDQPDAVVRTGPLMERVLASLFALNNVRVALEIPHVLGRRSDMDEAFGVLAAPAPLGPAPSVRIVESVWEVERYVPIHGWTKTQDKRWRELPSSEWIWETEWTLASATSASGWAYAKTFDDRFHDKERKFDSVRRRKWVRRRRLLPPVLIAVSPPALSAASPRPNGRALLYTGSDASSGRERSSSTKSGPASPPALFGTASLPVAPVATVVTLGAGKVRNLKQFFDASKRSGGLGKAKTDDAAALGRSSAASPPPRTLLKRRSNSFDKAMLAEAVADLALASPPSTPAASPAPAVAATGKPKRRSIPSLRRSQTSSEKDVKTALGLVRSTTTGSAAARPRDLVVQTDADESVCFRCLVPLDSDRDDAETGQTCPSCEQRVCPACLDCFAFATLPPPLEVSRKSRMCRACYDRWTRRYRLKLGAHVSKYFARDSAALSDAPSMGMSDATATTSDVADAAPVSPGPSAHAKPGSPLAPLTAKFEVAVFLRDGPAQAWSVVKSFQDFEALEKQLSEKLKKQEKRHGAGSCRGSHWKGVDYSELLDLAPRLTKLPVAALAYDKRLYVLDAFVQSLLASDTLCQSPAVQKFLLLSNAVAGSAVASPFSTFLTPPEAPLSPLALPTAPSSAPSAAGVLLLEHGKWRKGKWVAPETSSKETKVRLLQQLEVRLFAVVGEVFEFDGIGVVRRQLFAMSRSFVKAFLSASHFRKLEKQYASLTDSTRVAALLVAFRTYMFPDPMAPAVAPAAPLSPLAMQALRKDALDAIVASFPSTLVSLFGDTSCANAALKLHEFLQHEVFVKNLLFCIADDVLAQLFPDSAPFRPKAAHAEAQASRSK